MRTSRDLSTLSMTDLHKHLHELREQLVEQKKARAAGELANHWAIRKTRREIALNLTLLNKVSQHTEGDTPAPATPSKEEQTQ